MSEAYLRLLEIKRIRWEDREHFFAVAARLMRRILVDSARARAAHKRGRWGAAGAAGGGGISREPSGR